MKRQPLIALSISVLVGSCDGSVAPVPSKSNSARTEAPRFDSAHLSSGRKVWLGTCSGCHDIGVAGAPKLGDRAAWSPRIEKGLTTLHAHAIEGHFGPTGTMMPPRGGNPGLSDQQVRQAVDYMVAASGGETLLLYDGDAPR